MHRISERPCISTLSGNLRWTNKNTKIFFLLSMDFSPRFPLFLPIRVVIRSSAVGEETRLNLDVRWCTSEWRRDRDWKRNSERESVNKIRELERGRRWERGKVKEWETLTEGWFMRLRHDGMSVGFHRESPGCPVSIGDVSDEGNSRNHSSRFLSRSPISFSQSPLSQIENQNEIPCNDGRN